ncbi:MAG: molecular chaperone DnaK [Verrucomicrobia bacterium]|nr:molecular chaperone DnaK [Verrucomicrobiota bacterium]
MSKIVGIDLGTTHSLVAVVDAGIPGVLADPDGQRLTPSVVHYPAPDAPPLVGRPAHRIRILRPAETVYSVKRFMGRRGQELSHDERRVTYPVRGQGSEPVTLEIHGRTYTPAEVSAEVLKKLKGDAEAALGEPVTGAVITVPAYFNDAQRQATKLAGELAGFSVERIVNEPTAAALAYGLDRLRERSRLAVYDLGGGTFDLSILELHGGVFQVLATSGNTRLGGDDLDRRLADHLLERIRAAGGPDLTYLDPAAPPASPVSDAPVPLPPPAGSGLPPSAALPLLSRIREAAEQAKIRLSTETEVEVALPFLTPDFSFSCRLTRTELERLTCDLIERTRPHCLRALADAKLEAKDLHQVLLVGGQTRMPLVRQLVAAWFGCVPEPDTAAPQAGPIDPSPLEGPRLNTSQNPDEAVALGAAIQAEILAGGFQNLLLLDVTPLSLGLETFGGLMNVIIPRNSTLPIKAGELFTTAVDYQRSMLIHVLQGERERAADNWTLGRFTLEFEPAPKGVARVGVQFEIDANGILHVLARDVKTGRQVVVPMRSAVDVDDDAVQRMVEESVAHAFDDLQARQWIEAKLRAAETIAATRKGLTECHTQLDPASRTRIEAALAATEQALATEDTRTRTGHVPQLKAATAELDDATRPLADLMMDQAMEALLRKRGVIR